MEVVCGIDVQRQDGGASSPGSGRRASPEQRTQLFKPRVDDRYDAVKVVTHEGVNADALPVSTAAELVASVTADVAVVGVDEVQFFDASIVLALDELANRGKRVIVAGLDQDYRGPPLRARPGPRLAIAEYVLKLHAVCAQCGSEASRSQRLVAQEAQLFVGGAAAYEARCRACFVSDIVED